MGSVLVKSGGESDFIGISSSRHSSGAAWDTNKHADPQSTVGISRNGYRSCHHLGGATPHGSASGSACVGVAGLIVNKSLPGSISAQVLNSVTKLYILAYISLGLSKNAYPERSRSIQWT
jgi:hypothetical protein